MWERRGKKLISQIVKKNWPGLFTVCEFEAIFLKYSSVVELSGPFNEIISQSFLTSKKFEPCEFQFKFWVSIQVFDLNLSFELEWTGKLEN